MFLKNASCQENGEWIHGIFSMDKQRNGMKQNKNVYFVKSILSVSVTNMTNMTFVKNATNRMLLTTDLFDKHNLGT